MAAPPNELFILMALIGFLFCAVPFYWHLQAWNVGTCLFMAWVGLSCLNSMINAIIWNHNAINWSPVWCDISTRFMVGANVGIPAAMLIVMMRLYKIASLSKPAVTRAEKRRDIIIDLSIGLGIPLIQMPLQYVVQGNRFDIWEDIGCSFVTYPTWLAWVLFYPWPFVINCVTIVYGAMAYWHIRNRAVQFKEFMSSSTIMNQGRYMRLMAMISIALTVSFIGTLIEIILNASHPLFPWISWADTHFHFSDTPSVPRVLMPVQAEISLEQSRWMLVIASFIFFAFFGFADEARVHYRRVFSSIASRTGLASRTASIGNSSFGSPFSASAVSITREFHKDYSSSPSATISLPSMASKAHSFKRRSVDSFIDTLTIVSTDHITPDYVSTDTPRSHILPPGLEKIGDLEKTLDVPYTPRTTASFMFPATPRHAPDAPFSARPYSTFSDTV